MILTVATAESKHTFHFRRVFDLKVWNNRNCYK